MTLDTRVAIHEPMPVREVFAFAQTLLGTPDGVEPLTPEGNPAWASCARRGPFIANPGGIGLPAWLWVHYGADGPLRAFGDEPEMEGWAAIEVSFDTGYSYAPKTVLAAGTSTRGSSHSSATGSTSEGRPGAGTTSSRASGTTATPASRPSGTPNSARCHPSVPGEASS